MGDVTIGPAPKNPKSVNLKLEELIHAVDQYMRSQLNIHCHSFYLDPDQDRGRVMYTNTEDSDGKKLTFNKLEFTIPVRAKAVTARLGSDPVSVMMLGYKDVPYPLPNKWRPEPPQKIMDVVAFANPDRSITFKEVACWDRGVPIFVNP